MIETITPQYVNPSSQRGPASIKATNGQYYSIEEATTQKWESLLQQGQPVTVGLRTVTAKSGKAYTWIDKILEPTIEQPNGQQALGQPTTRVSEQISQQKGMFIMGVVGRSMGSGQFAASDIDDLTKKAAKAWDSLTGNLDAGSH
mgnify:CR=1 FL=1